MCNKVGISVLSFPESDTIRVSYTGYADKIIQIQRTKAVEVMLTRTTGLLPEIVVKPCTKWSKTIRYKPFADSGKFGGLVWADMGDKGRFSMYLPSPGTTSKLLSLTLDFRIGVRGTKEAAKAPIRFSFYAVDTSTMLPSALLTSRTILFHPKGPGRQQIDIDSLGLMIPDYGMYIALESYQDDAYGYWMTVNNSDAHVDSVKMYGAAIEGIYTKSSWLSFYNFRTNQWSFGGGKPFDGAKAHGAIKYAIKYAICHDKN